MTFLTKLTLGASSLSNNHCWDTLTIILSYRCVSFRSVLYRFVYNFGIKKGFNFFTAIARSDDYIKMNLILKLNSIKMQNQSYKNFYVIELPKNDEGSK